MSRQNSDHHDLRRHTGLPARLAILSAMLLGLLTHANMGHAFSIGVRGIGDIVILPPQSPFDPGFTVTHRMSCIPGIPCGIATSSYAVLGTSQGVIRAQFEYFIALEWGGYYALEFQATGPQFPLVSREEFGGTVTLSAGDIRSTSPSEPVLASARS